MEKSNKKFSIYTTYLDYNKETNSSTTIRTLEEETDEVKQVDPLYGKVYMKELFDIKTYNPKFESYYTRCAHFTTEDCEDDLHLWYDYGSHSRFIEIHFINREACNEYLAYQDERRKEYLKTKNN